VQNHLVSRALTFAAALAVIAAGCAAPSNLGANGVSAPISPQATSATSSAGRCAAADASTAPNLPVVHVGVGTSISPAILSFDRGYFAQFGVPVEPGPQINTGDVKLRVAALLSGQLDATGLTVDAGLFNAAAQGGGFKIVAGQQREDHGASDAALVLRKPLIDSGRVRTPTDLKGLRIGLVAHDAAEFAINHTLQAAGVSPSDVTISMMVDFQAMSAALSTGGVDAGLIPDTFMPRIVDGGVGINWLPLGDMVPGTQRAVLVFSPNLLANHELAVRTMMAYLCGARDYTDAFFKNIGRDQAVQEMIQATPMKDPALYDRMTFSATDPDGELNLANMQDQLNWYTQMGYVTQPLDLASVYDPSIAEEAVARLGSYE
jgi:NitT/TauT family transport system substrate-binding protein